jgi:hypothetical protein
LRKRKGVRVIAYGMLGMKSYFRILRVVQQELLASLSTYTAQILSDESIEQDVIASTPQCRLQDIRKKRVRSVRDALIGLKPEDLRQCHRNAMRVPYNRLVTRLLHNLPNKSEGLSGSCGHDAADLWLPH